MKRSLAKDVAEYLAEFQKRVTPELLAVQFYECRGGGEPKLAPPRTAEVADFPVSQVQSRG